MEQQLITVTELNNYIKYKLEDDKFLSDLLVTGEVSNFHHHSSGHMYFTLKDEDTRVKCVLFASYNRSLSFMPEDGMQVLIKGDIGLYQPRGEYQLYVKEIEPEGVGALHIAYEQLKKRLQGEGLFAAATKKELPEIPSRIGVITSPTGAAFRDFLSVAKRRFAKANILLAPATVQGEKAEESLLAALKRLIDYGEVEVIVITRGGGSLEDLWSFNSEKLARSVFAASVPIISAVGHETDYTILDFVADLRAPTPSAAAELVIPSCEQLTKHLKQLKTSLIRAMKEQIKSRRTALESLSQRRVFLEPNRELRSLKQRLDELKSRLKSTFKANFSLTKEKLEHQVSRLDSLSPLNTLARGYALCRQEDQETLSSVEEVEVGEEVEIVLADGKIKSEVTAIQLEKLEF
ncbi:exodeoxyribonuclease VII large subunit [Fuchsiella alkaliacetigena]|uniref:exodeoxyribonuclease VII large subunit n=1 Tax=Fuchsiella alkaliacetigena TaxID=957042 RepID=UPI00200B9262|nr:exodeoxyribonuclease VII large subunit [Fuchsiella alkaliacetigena]MCK8825444.1 exodeoxyribonuclease VII large subunit [Fuchsiella alkaliacetigena]